MIQEILDKLGLSSGELIITLVFSILFWSWVLSEKRSNKKKLNPSSYLLMLKYHQHFLEDFKEQRKLVDEIKDLNSTIRNLKLKNKELTDRVKELEELIEILEK